MQKYYFKLIKHYKNYCNNTGIHGWIYWFVSFIPGKKVQKKKKNVLRNIKKPGKLYLIVVLIIPP